MAGSCFSARRNSQVAEDLPQLRAIRVGHQRGRDLLEDDLHRPVRRHQRPEDAAQAGHQLCHAEPLGVDGGLPGLQPGEIQHVVEQLTQRQRGGADEAHLAALLRLERTVQLVLQQARQRLDRRDRRAELVADVLDHPLARLRGPRHRLVAILQLPEQREDALVRVGQLAVEPGQRLVPFGQRAPLPRHLAVERDDLLHRLVHLPQRRLELLWHQAGQHPHAALVRLPGEVHGQGLARGDQRHLPPLHRLPRGAGEERAQLLLGPRRGGGEQRAALRQSEPRGRPRIRPADPPVRRRLEGGLVAEGGECVGPVTHRDTAAGRAPRRRTPPPRPRRRGCPAA